MKTSFLICNYNSDDLLLRCISSIISLNNINIDIYIYDNCSTDNSLDLVIAKFNNNVHIVRGNNNLGYPKAINSIAKIATGENIFILNPDAYLLFDNQEFSELISTLNENKIFGFQIYNEENQLQRFDPKLPGLFWMNSSLLRFIYPFIFNIFYKLYFSIKSKNFTTNDTNNFLIPGCSLLLKRDLFYKLGMYNEDYFLYFDDTELLLNANRQNIQISLSNLKIKHNASYTVNKLENVLKVEKYKSFLIYVKKMYSINYYKKAKFNLCILCLISFSSPSILFNNDKRNYFKNLLLVAIKN